MMLLVLGYVFAALLVLPVLITLAQEVVVRWRYKHIPGPRTRWVLGNLPEVIKSGMLPCIDQWVKAHGPLLWFRLMSRHFVMVSDPDAARTVLTKCTNHAPLANPIASLMTGNMRAMELHGLLMAKDEYWRSLRNAWAPAFAPASLRGYQALMDREATSLVARLEARLAAAEAGAQNEEEDKGGAMVKSGCSGGGAVAVEVEVHSEMSRLTLAVVGSVAYGVDINSPEYGGSGGDAGQPPAKAAAAAAPSSKRGEPSLVAACNDWFRTMSPSARTKWGLATALPCALPLLRHVAAALPDGPLATHMRARRVLSKTSTHLIEGWRARHSDGGTDAAKAADSGGGASAPSSVRATASGGGGGGVAPGSFLGLMLAARDRSSGGRALSDFEIEAQVQTFLLAGFETTANTLAFATYLLALHPDKAEALVAELDEHMPPYGNRVYGDADGRGAVEQRGGAVHGGLDLGSEPELAPETLEKLVYTEAVVQEALRLYPPAHGTSRINDRPIKVLGYDIPAGTTFFIPIAHVQRDAAVWPDPEAFRPERFLPTAAEGGGGGDPTLAARHPHAHMPFGGGTRMCIGWRFALQEAKTVLARLFHRFRFELVAGQVPLPLSVGLTMAPKHGVLVRVSRRGGGG